jgi:prepilin-type N-terminal cleavage/methylation domain-containing protein
MRLPAQSRDSNAASKRHRFAMPAAGFTLIELILVMTILTIGISITAPALANFFRGRTLDSEARRFLSLTRAAESRASAEGIPMDLWLDPNTGSFGLEAEPSYEPVDPKAQAFTLDVDIEMDLTSMGTVMPVLAGATTASGRPVMKAHPNLTSIRFQPDGSISESSPQMVRLTGRDGISIWLVLSRNRLNYELRTANPS